MDAEADDVKPAEKPKKKKLEQSIKSEDMTPMRKKAKQVAKIEEDEDFTEDMIQRARDKRKAGGT